MAKSVSFPLKPGEIEVEFRFTIGAMRRLERAAGCSFAELFNRTQYIEAIVLLTCYGLWHADKSITVEKAEKLIEAYIDGGGRIVTLLDALQQALASSGCYGDPPSEDPQTATTAA